MCAKLPSCDLLRVAKERIVAGAFIEAGFVLEVGM